MEQRLNIPEPKVSELAEHHKTFEIKFQLSTPGQILYISRSRLDLQSRSDAEFWIYEYYD